ncbi:MAG: 50S ribosomal protein L10 [Acidaminococcaceae bacterium]|jgi:large subunit ribosomal protein L10|nr:50S ribosomal protein L10 [Acidaminococcaceae bacterium]
MHNVRPEKAAKVAEIKELLNGAKCTVLVNYCGLTVAEDTKFRRGMREAGVKYVVVKNTLLRIAAQEVGIEGLEAHLEQNTAIAVAPEDPVEVCKIIEEFAKDHKALEIKAGVLDGKLISEAEIKALAALPPKEVLLAKMLGSMQAPITGFVNVLQGTIRNAVYVLEAIREKKEKETA